MTVGYDEGEALWSAIVRTRPDKGHWCAVPMGDVFGVLNVSHLEASKVPRMVKETHCIYMDASELTFIDAVPVRRKGERWRMHPQSLSWSIRTQKRDGLVWQDQILQTSGWWVKGSGDKWDLIMGSGMYKGCKGEALGGLPDEARRLCKDVLVNSGVIPLALSERVCVTLHHADHGMGVVLPFDSWASARAAVRGLDLAPEKAMLHMVRAAQVTSRLGTKFDRREHLRGQHIGVVRDWKWSILPPAEVVRRRDLPNGEQALRGRVGAL